MSQSQWTTEQQQQLTGALRLFPSTMDKLKRWKSIGGAVLGKNTQQCIERVRELQKSLKKEVLPAAREIKIAKVKFSDCNFTQTSEFTFSFNFMPSDPDFDASVVLANGLSGIRLTVSIPPTYPGMDKHDIVTFVVRGCITESVNHSIEKCLNTISQQFAKSVTRRGSYLKDICMLSLERSFFFV